MARGSEPREWFRDWFNEDYTLVYGHRDDREAEAFVANWPFRRDDLPTRLCLDLGCGAGRLSRAVAGLGMLALGIDLSTALLRMARDKQTEGTHFVRADFRRPPLRSGVGLAVSLFTSFGYFGDDVEHLAALQSIAATMAPGAVIVIDHANRLPALQQLSRPTSRCREVSDALVTESWNFTDDMKRIQKRIIIESPSGQRSYHESVRLFSPEELTGMMEAAGFQQFEPLWGDYEGGSMGASSSRMIYFGRRCG